MGSGAGSQKKGVIVIVARKSIGIGLMGLGVIGGGVAKVLMGKPDTLTRDAGSKLVLKKVLEKD